MRELKVLFVGVGSIGRRHIRNLAAICREQGIALQMDALRSGHGQALPEDIAGFVGHTWYDVVELPHYDAIFITNPTSCHYETLGQLKDKAKYFFLEKPAFVTGQEDIAALELPEDLVCYVACPLRYTQVIRYVKEHIDFRRVHAVRAISSSYLPDWRPGQDYRQCYSAHRDMGGGVSIDLIHEWDYLCYLLGMPQAVKSFIRRKSQLEIDSDDIAVYIAEYPDKLVELHLDYFGRQTVRRLELYAEEDTIVADLEQQKITWKKAGRVFDFTQERDDYQRREIMHFLDIMAGHCANDNALAHACEVLQITRGQEV